MFLTLPLCVSTQAIAQLESRPFPQNGLFQTSQLFPIEASKARIGRRKLETTTNANVSTPNWGILIPALYASLVIEILPKYDGCQLGVSLHPNPSRRMTREARHLASGGKKSDASARNTAPESHHA